MRHVTTSSPLSPARRITWAVLLASMLAIIVSGQLPTTIAHEPNELDQQYTLSQASTQQQFAQMGNKYLNTSGATFGENMAVLVCAVFSNPCRAQAGVEVTFTAQPSTGGASGNFWTTTTDTATELVTTTETDTATAVSGSNGIATAPPFRTNAVAGSYTVRIVANEPTPHHAVPTFYFFTNTVGNPAGLAATISDAGLGLPMTARLNGSFPRIQIALFNGGGGFATGVPVTFSAPTTTGASGTFDAGCLCTPLSEQISSYTTVTGGTGLASAYLFANGIVGTYTVKATVSGTYTATGRPLTMSYSMTNTGTVVGGVPAFISAAAGNAQHVGILSPFPQDLQVAVVDGNGALLSGASVTFTTPSTGPSATFAGGSHTFSTTTAGTGLATAAQLTSNGTAGQFAVTVSATLNNVTITSLIGLINGRVMTTTTLTKSPAGTSVYGEPVVLTATVSPVEGTYVPTGAVSFKQGSTAIPECTSVTPSGGVATCTFSGLSDAESTWLGLGDYSYSASYFGDTISQPSASGTVSHTVIKASTTVTLVSSKPTFVIEGESVTFTATVNVTAPGRGTLAGTVTFRSSDGTTLASSDLVNGTAAVSTSALKVGTPTVTATYSGGTNFNGSNKGIIQNVYSIPVVTTDPSNEEVLVGETVTFTAAATGFPIPTVQWQVSTDGTAFTDISGATAATYSFTAVRTDDQKQYRAIFTNLAGTDTSAAATLTVRQPPSFTSDAAATFTVGEAGSFTVIADGHPLPTISQTGGTLPAGVSFDPTTGILSGTPAPGTGGAHTLQFTATNSIVPDAVQTFILTVNEAPAITSPDATTFTAVTANSFTFTASGYPSASFSVAETLPDGLSLSSAGVLSGTPTIGGSVTLMITAANGTLPDATQSFTLTIDKAAQAALMLTVTPDNGMTGDRLALDTSGGNGDGNVSFATGASTACALDSGALLITDGEGACAVTATKAGDGTYLVTTSNTVTVTVSKSATDLSVGDGSGTFDETVSISATLTLGGVPVAGKVVSFTGPGNVALGTATTDRSGVAALVKAPLTGINAGTYADGVEASFAGDSAYEASTASAGLTVARASGAVTISNLPASAGVGNSVTLRFVADGDGTPSAVSRTQTVCTVENGMVTFLYQGACRLEPSITEGANHLAATGDEQTMTVTAAAKKATTTTLTSSLNPAGIGQAVTLTAQIAPDPKGGNVTFLVNGSTLGMVPVGAKGRATITLPTATAGTTEVRVIFDGTTTHTGSQSTTLVQQVAEATAPTTTTTIRSSANPIIAGQAVTFTAVVNPTSATGTVTFRSGGTVLGTVPVSGGQAVFTVALAKGTYSVTATYSGGGTYTGSVSGALSQVVEMQKKANGKPATTTQSEPVRLEPTAVPPTPVPPTAVPPTQVPPTAVPPTQVPPPPPPTEVPPPPPPTEVPPPDTTEGGG